MRYEEYTEQIKESGEIVLSVSSENVETLSWENESGTFSFYINEEEWLYEEDEAFPVDEQIIDEMLGIFDEMSAAFIIEEVEDYSQYGLDDPECMITFATADATYEIQVGAYSQLDEQRYVSIGDGNVYLLNHDPLEEYDAVMSDVIQHDERLAYDSISEIIIDGSDSYSIVYEEESANTYSEDVYFALVDGEEEALDSDFVDGYLSAIQYLDLTNYVSYNVTEEELETYGLNDPELSISVDCIILDEDGNEVAETFELYVSRHIEDVDIELSEETEETEEAYTYDSYTYDTTGEETEEEIEEEEEVRVYVRVGSSPIIYQITTDEYKELLACNYDDFRHLELYTGEFADITEMDIVVDGETYTITSEEEDEERVYSYLEEELDITTLQSAIEYLEVDSFTDDEPTGESEIAITLYLEDENYTDIEIELFREDGEYCIATIDGEPIGVVERALMVDVVEAINAIVL